MHQQGDLIGATQLCLSRTDILYANAKDLVQNGKILIRVTSLSLVCFRHLSILARGQLISFINIYHLFAGAVYHVNFSPV